MDKIKIGYAPTRRSIFSAPDAVKYRGLTPTIRRLSAFWSARVVWAKRPSCPISLIQPSLRGGSQLASPALKGCSTTSSSERNERRHLVDTNPSRKIKGAGIADLFSVELEDSPRELSNWRSRMDDILDALAECDTGLLVTIDEVNPDIDEMVTLVAAFQHFLDEGKKVALIMAGLPYAVTSLLSGKSTSFLRRAARYELQALNDYEVEEALVRTMRDGGKSFEPDALEAAIDAIKGFPFMLQLAGYRTWRMAEDSDVVDISSVNAAASIARKELDQRVYEAIWFELSEADKSLLWAMSEDSGVTKQTDLAGRLNKKSGHVSKYKKRLLQHGVIQERSRGLLEFCLPGFREYFLERIAEERDL